MRTSCVQHPSNDPYIRIRKWQVDLCDGNVTAAALLAFFEYWHNIKLEHQEKARHANDVAEMHGEKRTQDEGLWQFHTEQQLEDGIMVAGRRTIRDALKLLEERGYITVGRNPNRRYRFDKTRYIIFHPEEVKIPDLIGEKASRRGKKASLSGENAAAIENVTPNISSEESPPVLLRNTSPAGETSTPQVNMASAKRPRPQRFVPDTFEITPTLRQWATTEVPGLNLDHETAKMRDHEFKTPHSDWEKAWRNWMRTAWGRLPAHEQKPQPPAASKPRGAYMG